MYGGHISRWWMFFRNFLFFINWLTNPCITATLPHSPHKLNNQLSLLLAPLYSTVHLFPHLCLGAPQTTFHYCSFKLYSFYCVFVFFSPLLHKSHSCCIRLYHKFPCNVMATINVRIITSPSAYYLMYSYDVLKDRSYQQKICSVVSFITVLLFMCCLFQIDAV